MDAKKLVDNARKILVEAQLLCQESNSQIYTFRNDLSLWQRQLMKLKFVIGCLKQQGSFLLHCVLEKGISEKLIRDEWGNNVLKELVSEMRIWQDKITDQVSRLDQIDNVLVHTETGTLNPKLSDYISRDNVNILDERLMEMPVIQKQIESIKSQYASMLKKVKENVNETTLREIELTLEDKFGNNCPETITLSETCPDELDKLEKDLAEFISSITEHYDKTKLLETYEKKNLEMYESLYEVVTEDNNELPCIMTSLKEKISLVDRTLLKYQTVWDKKKLEKKLLQQNISKMNEEFKKYYEYLQIFKDISNLISTFKESCIADIQMIKDLFQFYKNFEKSYEDLLAEVERRKLTCKKMKAIILQCEEKLQALSEEDLGARELFLNDNGNYLPENIWPNKIDDFSPLYRLEYHIEEL